MIFSENCFYESSVRNSIIIGCVESVQCGVSGALLYDLV